MPEFGQGLLKKREREKGKISEISFHESPLQYTEYLFQSLVCFF